MTPPEEPEAPRATTNVGRLRLLALSKLAEQGINAIERAAELAQVTGWQEEDGDWVPWHDLDAAIGLARAIDEELANLAEGFRVACARYDSVRAANLAVLKVNTPSTMDDKLRRFRALDAGHPWKLADAALRDAYGAMWKRIEALV